MGKDIEIERWLKANTFECPHGLGRLSPMQCEALRKRPSQFTQQLWHYGGAIKPKQCESCEEWKELCKKEREKMKEEIICKECGQKATNHARGLCHKCYYKLRSSGILDKKYPKHAKTRAITIKFDDIPSLFDELKQLAEDEMRPLAVQVKYMLKKHMEEHYGYKDRA